MFTVRIYLWREREREHYTDQELSTVATVPRSKTPLILASCQGIGSGRNKMAYYIGKSVPTAILAYLYTWFIGFLLTGVALMGVLYSYFFSLIRLGDDSIVHI